nr:hypothetical protein [Parapedobacter soli]
MIANQKSLERDIGVFLFDGVSLMVFFQQAVHLQEYFPRYQSFVITFHHLAFQHVVCHQAAIKRVPQDIGHMLFADLKPFFGKLCPNALRGEVIIGFPFECLSDEPTPGIGHDLALTVLPDDIVTERWFGWPVSAKEHLPDTCHALLSTQLVVELAEQKKHLLLHLPGCIRSVDGLRYGDNFNA